MPDIDMDFGDTRRGEVVEYVRRKYGDDHVAQIVTFGTMAARGVIRDVGRALNMSYADCDVIAKLVPAGPHVTLDDALRISRELREKYEGDEQVKKLIDTARALEGMPRHASTHAAGVVITKRPVVDYVPLARNDDTIVCQYVMTTLEELGLLKMDFLGLRNLTILDDAVKTIREKDKNFTLAGIPENDAATYEMLAAGRTSGVFQLESSGMTGVCVSLKPQNIEDITALIALYRPGPMESIPKFIACKHDPKKVTYLIPQLEPILSITYGCIVYQEQVIQIFQQLAGYSLGQADMLRRAMSKKKVKDIEREREAFLHGDPARNISGCVANGIDEKGRAGNLRGNLRLRELRVQQGARRGLCGRRISDGVLQVPLYERIHGGTALERARLVRQGGRVLQRVPRVRHQAPAAGRQPFRRPLHGRARGHPLRPRRHQEHRPRAHFAHDARARAQRPVRRLSGFLPPHGRHGDQ